MSDQVPPRIYCIPATDAPIVAVFRRGPTNWAHVGRWDVANLRYEPGAWLTGRLFPRRSDVSPDGKFLCYFAHKPDATWELGDAYVSVSKLPWLTALHAFGTCGTWTRGYFFTNDAGKPDDGMPELPIPYQLRAIQAVQFETERRRGWEEAPDCPPRDPRDAWDERRNARMQKRQPGGSGLLCVESVGLAGGEFGAQQAIDGLFVRYSLEADGHLTVRDEWQWADWDRQGRLLAATRSGKLQVLNLETDPATVVFEEDLSGLRPTPVPPPDWANTW
ncbi:hypothetical protein YTPLAS18_11160 [Nitrospira sp.]|nr:hypothetical protein YTPLAS18_11160 [Nitrospira sp.]